MTTTDNRARQQAEAQLEHIRNLMEWLDHANSCDEFDPYDCKWNNTAALEHTGNDAMRMHNQDAATQAIHESPLSIEVRSDWVMVGMLDEDGDMIARPTEYRILLCTGGPAVRIIGELDEYGSPESARIEYQDWFTPWTEYGTSDDPDYSGHDVNALLRYAQQFYCGS